MKKTQLISSLALASLMVGSAQAATTSAASSSTASKLSTAKKIRQDLTSSYFGIFTGGAANDPLAKVQPDLETGVTLDNQLTLGYKITPKLTASINPVYTIRALGNDGMTASNVRLSHSSLISRGGFNLGADLRAYPGVTDDLKASNINLYLRSDQVASYTIPGSRFGLGLITSVRNYQRNSKADANAMDFKFKAIPNAEYRVSSKLAVTAMYEMAMAHNKGDPATSMNNAGTYFEPGLSWDISPTMNLNPYVDIATGTQIKAATSQIGAILAWKLL